MSRLRRRSFLAGLGLLPVAGMFCRTVIGTELPGTPVTPAVESGTPPRQKRRITHASQLRRGMVVILHHPQTHSAAVSPAFDIKPCVVTAILNDRFRVIHLTNVAVCHKHHDGRRFFGDYQVTSKAVPKFHPAACNWVEVTGRVSEQEVQRMLADDCLVCCY